MSNLVCIRIRRGSISDDAVLDALAEVDADLLDAPADQIAAILATSNLRAVQRGLAEAGLPRSATVTEPAVTSDYDGVAVLTLRPMTVGSLCLVPRGQQAPSDASNVVVLDSAGTFGSGMHPTTQLCLERMADWPTTTALLDVGTGTGVLALGWLRRGGPSAVGTDIDPTALAVAQQNACDNGLAANVVFTDKALAHLGRTFDRVVANIVAAPLIALAPAMVRCLGRSARLLVSGFIETQADEVLAAFKHEGLLQSGRWAQDGWVCLELATPW